MHSGRVKSEGKFNAVKQDLSGGMAKGEAQRFPHSDRPFDPLLITSFLLMRVFVFFLCNRITVDSQTSLRKLNRIQAGTLLREYTRIVICPLEKKPSCAREH